MKNHRTIIGNVAEGSVTRRIHSSDLLPMRDVVYPSCGALAHTPSSYGHAWYTPVGESLSTYVRLPYPMPADHFYA